MRERTYNEECYANVADELNDWDVHHGPPERRMTLQDLDERDVVRAHAFAQANNFNWPPGVGDFDLYYEWRMKMDKLCPRCLVGRSYPICNVCGVDRSDLT